MNPLIKLKTTPPLLITLTLLCFGLSPTAKALLPPPVPDGGYPGGNTAEGDNALHDLTTGLNNTAVGASALGNNTTGGWNVAIGGLALGSNTTGQQNMAIGAEALRNSNGNFNLAIGFRTAFMNTTGNRLTGVGAAALRNNTTASDNTAIGADALRENTTGPNNTAIGADALRGNTTGSGNTAIGEAALYTNSTGSFNTATGGGALDFNATGTSNTANGVNALFFNTTGSDNTANGVNALIFNYSGSQNTAVGEGALLSSTGDNNTALGFIAGNGVTTADNVICIGNGVAGANVSDTTWIGNIYGVTTQNGTTAPVIVSADGQLGTVASSERFKKDIATMEKASEAIMSLRPVTFHYKTDTTGTPQFGLIAEEVAKVNPALVLRDKEGKPYTVRYEAVNAMLLNEFLKEHRKNEEQGREIQEQKATIALQQKQIDALTAGLQRVSAQLEASKPAPQVVNNP